MQLSKRPGKKGEKHHHIQSYKFHIYDDIFRFPFETFDILNDDDVRQGLKVYSDWPTYPQVYVKGELIGGLDIIKELKKNNELEKTLKGEK